MKASTAVVCGFVAASSVGCLAQEARTASVQAPTSAEPVERGLLPAAELIAGLPDTLIGATATRVSGSPLTLYLPKRLGVDPSAGILAVRGGKSQLEGDLGEQVRESFHESGLRRIFREATFTTSKFPTAKTFYGEYLTGSGYKQTWLVIDGENRFNVIVTYFKLSDSERLREEVSEKIFKGATIGPGAGQLPDSSSSHPHAAEVR